MSIIQNSSFSVRINDINGPYCVGRKGLKQGDPFPPMLFNLVADVFSRMLAKAFRTNVISEIIPYIVPDSLVSLQYVADMTLFLDPNLECARNLKWLLSCFD